MKKIEMNPIESVLENLRLHFLGGYQEVETVTLEESYGRTLAEAIISDEIIPAFPKSTVDGYAVRSFTEPCVLNLIGKIGIGTTTDLVLSEGQCLYVPTGAFVPEGAQAMVMIETTSQVDPNHIRFMAPAPMGDNIINRGADMQLGDVVLQSGRVIREQEIGALASLGKYRVKVLKRPRVTLLSTGDELVDGEAAVQPSTVSLGQIREVNSYTLGALCRKMGLEVIGRKVLCDDYQTLLKEVGQAIEVSDMVIVSGGSSVGEKDYTYDLLSELCTPGVLSSGMAIKPGKPTIIAKHGNKPVIGLPGHPVSAIVVFKLIVGEILKTWGYSVLVDHGAKARLTKTIYGAPGRDTYQMVTLCNENGQLWAKPTSGKSGMITLLTNSNGYVIIPKSVEKICAGEEVMGYYFE